MTEYPRVSGKAHFPVIAYSTIAVAKLPKRASLTSLLESEQGPLRNGSHVRALFQSQVGPVDLLRTRSIFPGVLF